jgi:prepilin-type N-terminal cleavage/methylation domain-containing protein
MNKSFTLIEILVVIVIIGVLSAFILVGMSSITNSANIAKSQAFLNSLDNSLLLARVSQWKLDDTITTDSWGTNMGTIAGATSTTNCVQNSCYSFDGNDYINCGHVIDNGKVTITLWFKSTNTAQQTLFSFIGEGSKGHFSFNHLGNEPIIYLAGSNYRYFNNSAANYIDGKWHMLYFYLSGSGQTDILNSVLKIDTIVIANSSSLTGEAQYVWTNFYIGSGQYLDFNGSIDDVRIYNQEVPTSEIQQNYYSGINKLLVNNRINLSEFNQRIVELKSNLSENGF